MPKKRTEDMGQRYDTLRNGGMSAKDAVEKVNAEFGTTIHAGTIRRYGAEVKRKAAQEHLTTPLVTHTTGATEADTTPEVSDTTSDLPHDTSPVVDTEGKEADASTTSGPEATTNAGTEGIPHRADNVVTGQESLSGDEVAALRKILSWWNQGGEQTAQRLKGVTVESLVTKPIFPGKKTNSGIRINDRLFRAAVKKAKTPEEAPRTGGSLSSLIEVLLWSYLENDPQFLEESKSASQEDTEADRPVDTTSVRV